MAKSVKRSMALKGNNNAAKHGLGAGFGATMGAGLAMPFAKPAAMFMAKSAGPMVIAHAAGLGASKGLLFGGTGALVGAAIGGGLSYLAYSKLPIQNHARHTN